MVVPLPSDKSSGDQWCTLWVAQTSGQETVYIFGCGKISLQRFYIAQHWFVTWHNNCITLILGSEELVTKFAGQCIIDHECPEACSCDGTVVDCSKRGLAEIPSELPMFTTELNLQENKITEIKNTGLFEKLVNLKTLNLSNNFISKIENNAFLGGERIEEL